MALVLLLQLLALVGCSSDAPKSPNEPPPKHEETVEPPKVEPKDPLFDQLHSGLFQADPAVKKLAEAVSLVKDIESKSTGNLQGYLKETMIPTLDDAGATLADMTGEDPPTMEQIKADHPKYAAKRDTMINQISDLLRDVREEADAADDMATTAPPETLKESKRLNQLLSEIIDDLSGALSALGGKEEKPQSQVDTADTNQKVPGFDPNSAGTTG